MQKKVYKTKSAEETAEIGQELARKLATGGVLFLYGDLGSGKTTFTQGFAKELGITRHIISPTFLLLRTYDLPSQSQKTLYHLDLYRIGSEREIEELGVPEIITDPGNIVIIEWSEKMGGLLPAKRHELHFHYVDDMTRTIEEVIYD